jgi:hypothetical protein
MEEEAGNIKEGDPFFEDKLGCTRLINKAN